MQRDQGRGGMWLTVAALGLAATPALAQPAAQANAVVATAPPPVVQSASPATDATGAQIQAWIHGDDEGGVVSGAGIEPDVAAPRQVHGEVSAGFGSDGYSSVSGVADIPVGQASDLVVGASRGSFGARGFRGTGQSLSIGLFLNGAAPPRRPCAQAAPGVQPYAGPGLPAYAAPAAPYGGQGACGADGAAADGAGD